MTNHRVRLRRTSLAVATMLAIGGCIAANAAPSIGTSKTTVATATRLHSGDVITGIVPSTQPIHIVVSLKMRNPDQLQSFLAAANSPNAVMAQRTMTTEQFNALHEPTEQQAQKVVDFLTNAGFQNVQVASNRMLVTADGTAATAQAAFATSIVQVQTADGRTAYANNDDVRIPTSLEDSVLAVIGLQNLHQAHTMVKAQNGAQPLAVTGHNPTEFASIYGGSGQTTGAGVTVGIITSGKLTQTVTDLNTFTSQNGLATVTTQTVNTDGTSSSTSGVDEWNLDSQDIVGMAGGQIGKLIFYNIPSLSNTDLTDDFNTVVSANAAKVINVSLGECETDAQSDGSAAAQDQAFSQAVAQGQTFSVSTGDSGADECGNGGTTPSWPAASQYVIAAAGTTLNASTTTWSSETVWVDSGGSQSTFEPKPSWQTLWTGTHRGVADVAFDGDPNSGAKIIVNGASEQVGGTSLSSPLFVGTWSRVIAAKGTGVGFAGPLVYQLPTSSFHDITSGNNGGETATTGYDLASGRGSMIISSVLSNVGGGGGGGGGTPTANFSFVTSGLTATFTDSSTDSGGTITSHSWTFGDGGTSTATNPSHTYAAAGTYSVTETVTDSASGKNSSKTESVTVTSGGGGGSSQLLANTGFESSGSWTATAGVLCTNSTCSGETAHAGTGFAWLDGYGTTHTDTLSQAVTIPSGKSTGTLQFYLHINTSETTKTTAYDTLTVQVGSTTVATFSNLNSATGYTVHSYNVSVTPGANVTVKFTGKEDSSLQTSFVVDDVTFTVQ